MSFIKKISKIKKQLSNKIKDKVEELKKIDLDEVKDKAKDFVEEVKEKAEEIDKKYEISEKVNEAKEVVMDKVEEVKDKVEEKIESLKDGKISFDDFAKVEIKLGKIIEAEKIKKSKKLLKLKVDFGDETRQVVSGIAEYYDPEKLIGKKSIFVTNLEPRKIMGYESEAMILGLSDDKKFTILVPDKKRIKEGTKAS